MMIQSFKQRASAARLGLKAQSLYFHALGARWFHRKKRYEGFAVLSMGATLIVSGVWLRCSLHAPVSIFAGCLLLGLAISFLGAIALISSNKDPRALASQARYADAAALAARELSILSTRPKRLAPGKTQSRNNRI